MKTYVPSILFVLSLIAFTQCQPSKKAMEIAQNQYIQYCGACHGRNAEYLKEKDQWMFAKDYPSIYKAIKEGVPSAKMPPYQNRLSDKEIQNIAKFVLKKVKN